MEYISQLNAYNLKLITEPISPNARSVYMSLMDINNKLGWAKEFSMSNGRLAGIAGLSIQQLNRARQELIDSGFIKYQKGSNKQQAGQYKIVPLYQKIENFDIKTELKPNQNRTKTETLNRLDKDIDQTMCKEKEEKEKPTEENTPTHENKKKTSTSKAKKEAKIKYAENVEMTEAEYQKLLKDNNNDVELVKACISKLDNYKGSSGKKYKSDYRAILSWVLDDQKQRLLKQGNKTNQISKKGASYDVQQAERQMRQGHIVYRRRKDTLFTDEGLLNNGA